MAEDMVLSVVICAEDEASTAIAKIENNLDGVGAVATATSKQLANLENALIKQKSTTQQYTKNLKEISQAFQIQKTAEIDAARAYNKSKIATEESNKALVAQARSLDGAINLKKSEISSYEKANLKLDSHTQAYKDNKKAISWCTTELKDLEKRRKGIDTQINSNNRGLKSEEVAYRNAQAQVEKAAAAYEEAEARVKQSKKAEAQYNQEIEKTKDAIEKQSRIKITSKDFGENLDKATKPLQAVSVGLLAAGAASAKVAIDFEKGFAAVKKTVDGTPEQLEAVKKGIIDLTTVGIGGRNALPATTAELNAIAAAAGQLGIKRENVVELTEVMAQMGSATNLAGEAGAATLARFMNVTNTDQGLIRNLGSSIVALGNNFATTEAEIAAMAMRMGATGTIVGMSTQDILAYSTALSSLGIEAEAGGSAFSRILMSISTAVSSGGSELNAFAKTAGMTGKEFAKAWKNDATGTFKEFLEGLSKSEDVISKLEELGFANIRDIQGLQNLSGERGIELITEALKLSNEAWEENAALQKEADAMTETLAGQLTITKNNIAETGRSFGEFIMPSVAGASDKVREFTQGLAQMDDSGKKALINTATAVVGLGAAAKLTSSTAKTIGNIKDAVGALGIAAKPLGVTALAIATVTAVVSYGIGKYEEYQYAQKHWADGAEKAASAASEAVSKVNRLGDLQREIKDLQIIISSSESTNEEIEAAKRRLNEIAQLLENEYNLTIETNNENLDETIEKLQTAIDKYKEMTKSELALRTSELRSELSDGKEQYKNHDSRMNQLNSDYEYAIAEATKYNDAARDALTAINEFYAAAEQGDTSGLQDMLDIVNDLIVQTGADKAGIDFATGASEALQVYKQFYEWYEKNNQASIEAKNNINAETEAYNKQVQARQNLIDAGIAQVENGDIEAGVKNMQAAVSEYGAVAEDVALKWSLVKNGFETVDGAKAAGAFETVQAQAAELLETYLKFPPEIESKVILEADTSGISNADVPPLTGKIKYIADYTSIPQPGFIRQAKGTQNFPGGLAMVNDQTGISDPRELIVDRGRAFIPQGRNVLLPLSRGAKVYTAAQTKAIMSALGVPMYASGKDNSDGFIAARDNLTHRKSTSAMSVTDELAEWVKLSEQFKSNQQDVWDIQEQIYSLTRKQTDELNEQSKAYIKERTALADWAEYGDDPMSAFNRVKERNLAEFSAGRMTWQEYTDTMSEFGELMLDERISQSEKWLDHERKYNDMSVEDYIAGLQRMQEYTLQYYEQGLINLEAYNAAASEINDKYLDAVAERNDNQYSAWEKSMDNWINMRETYGDWDEFGDSLSQTYARAIVRQEDFYNAGLISWQEKEDAKLEYSLEMYKAASDEYDAVLAEQSEHISEMRDKFAAEEEALRSSWEVKDRSTDLAEVEHLLSIYKNAATDAGQEKYKELLKQKEQLEREEQLYQLQVDNNATLDKLQAEYDEMEANKKNVLARLKVSSSDIASTNADISADVERTRELANEIGIVYAEAANSTLNSLGEVVSLLEGIKKVLGSRSTNTYNDNKNISISSGVSENYVSKLINGTIVSGLGSIMFNG